MGDRERGKRESRSTVRKRESQGGGNRKREEEAEWMKLDSKLYKASRGTNEGRGRKMESRGDLREPD